MLQTTQPVGALLRDWRQRRRLSQLDLALSADVSPRHLSFLETGRSQPSREMVLRLAEELDVPLRERNTLLVAAGYAPVYTQATLDDPAMRAAREAIDLVLAGHEPYPALAVDRYWNLVAANRAVDLLMAGIPPALREPPVNVLRASLHPEGLAPAIVGLAAWREHILTRLQRQIDATADPALAALRDELRAYPIPAGTDDAAHDASAARYGELIVPLRLRLGETTLSFLTTTTVFGAAHDITLAELAIESFFPADAETAQALRRGSPG